MESRVYLVLPCGDWNRRLLLWQKILQAYLSYYFCLVVEDEGGRIEGKLLTPPCCFGCAKIIRPATDCRTHVLATAFHHDHCTIIQVAYSLAQFLAILYDFDNNIFSR